MSDRKEDECDMSSEGFSNKDFFTVPEKTRELNYAFHFLFILRYYTPRVSDYTLSILVLIHCVQGKT